MGVVSSRGLGRWCWIGAVSLLLAALPAAARDREPVGAKGPSLATHDVKDFRNVVRSIVRFAGDLWVGYYGLGLFRIPPEGPVVRYVAATSPLLEDRVNCLAVRGRELWIGTCGGINVFDGKTWRSITPAHGVSGTIYHCIHVDRLNHVWVGTTGNGLSLWDGKRWTVYTTANGLANNWINDVRVSRTGAVWVATLGGPCVAKSGRRWLTERPSGFPVYRNATALAEQGGVIWLGSSDGGLFAWEAGAWMHPPASLLPHNHVTSLLAHSSGDLWIGTRNGLVRYRRQDGWKRFGKKQGLSDGFVKTLFEEGDGTIVAGTNQGYVYAYTYDAATDKTDDGVWKVLLYQGKRPPAEGGTH